MAKVVLVHGIAQENRDADELAADWFEAALEGLRKAGPPEKASSLRREDVVMAYYGSLFRTSREGAQGAGEEEGIPPEASELAEQLAMEWIERARDRARDERYRSDGLRAAEMLESVPDGAEAQGLRDPLRRVLAAAAKIRCFAKPTMAVAERTVIRSLRQVTLYLTNGNHTRERALAAVHAHLSADTQVVIGHSLGSVVAYEACHQLTNTLPLLITIGSPLGLDTIVYQRTQPQPPRFPSRVQWWVNVADPDDIVAADPTLRDRFPPPESKKLTDGVVDNRMKAHSAVNYLKQPEVVYPLAMTLR